MEPADELATDLRLAQQVRDYVNTICGDLSAEARKANNMGKSALTYELSRNFDLDCPVEVAQTFIYGMIIEDLEKKGYRNIKITPPATMQHPAFIEFGWRRDLGEGELNRYKSLINKHKK